MDNVFVLSESSPYAAGLKRNLEWKHKVEVSWIDIPRIEGDVLNIFSKISNSLDKYSPNILRNSIGIIDEPFNEQTIEDKMEPLFSDDPFGRIASMLVLAYPEIFWIFPIYYKSGEQNRPHTYYWLDIENKIGEIMAESSSIFDDYGLRSHIRKRIKHYCNLYAQARYLRYLRERSESRLSGAIDEEEPYAFLHGYLAYKMGYRSFLVTTKSMMGHVFGEKKERRKISLTFEDMFLNFPDGTRETPLSDLEERDSKYPGFRNVDNRIFVTVGHDHIPEERRLKNRSYIKTWKYLKRKTRTVYKPSGGMYNLLEKGGLIKEYWRSRKEDWLAAMPESDVDETTGGHSAPGRLLLIAEKLIDRAEKIFYEAKKVQDCIHGATLALEAQELLGYRTPTTSLEAIALKHKLEVKAECMFYGVEYNIDVNNRLKEIKYEMDAISRWFNPTIKRRAALNAQKMITTEVMRIFNEHGQFEEEQVCLQNVRSLNRKWSLLQPGLIGILLYIALPFRYYFDALVSKLRYFVFALLGWPLFFGVLSWKLGSNYEIISLKNIEKSFSLFDHIINSFFTFYGLQPVKFPANPAAQILSLAMVMGGFLHLGIFISYLYTLMTRK